MGQSFEMQGEVLQTISSIIMPFLSCVAILVLFSILSAVREAVRAAFEQADAVSALAEACKSQQVAAERIAEAVEAQLAAARAIEELAHQQLLAAHTPAANEASAVERPDSEQTQQPAPAQLRPILSFSHRNSNYLAWTVLENPSEALALEVTAYNGTPESPGKPITVSHGAIAPGVEAQLEGIDWGPPKVNLTGNPIFPPSIPVFARYKSEEGRWFHTKIDLRDSEHSQVMEEESGT
jgi:hypothetical protein